LEDAMPVVEERPLRDPDADLEDEQCKKRAANDERQARRRVGATSVGLFQLRHVRRTARAKDICSIRVSLGALVRCRPANGRTPSNARA
jgi:hypothetical protein